MSVRTPLARARGLGSAGNGSVHWRAQRYSSLLLLLLSVWVLYLGVSLAGADYLTAKATMSSPFHGGMAILLAGSLFYHTKQGLQVVIEDYVHLPAVGFVLQLFVRLACLVAFLISAIAALKLVLGA